MNMIELHHATDGTPVWVNQEFVQLVWPRTPGGGSCIKLANHGITCEVRETPAEVAAAIVGGGAAGRDPYPRNIAEATIRDLRKELADARQTAEARGTLLEEAEAKIKNLEGQLGYTVTAPLVVGTDMEKLRGRLAAAEDKIEGWRKLLAECSKRIQVTVTSFPDTEAYLNAPYAYTRPTFVSVVAREAGAV